MKRAMLAILSIPVIAFVGCDFAGRRSLDGERADKLYRVAMEEYAAGRLDKSIDTFEKVLKANPGNVSARFQLACLLQDYRKDPLGAICNYREYLVQFPEGDKITIAKERAAACERLLATSLVKKYNLGGLVAQDEANARLRSDNARLTADLEETKKATEKLKVDLAALRRENDRIRRMVLAGAEDEASENMVEKRIVPVVTESKVPVMPDDKTLLEDDDAGVDRVKFSADVDSLIAEERDETGQVSPFGKTVRKEVLPKPAHQEPPHESRPEFYIVQEGDTLFKIAIRFYGRRSAWSYIRDANKAVVSSDGRIKVGQKLKLP